VPIEVDFDDRQKVNLPFSHCDPIFFSHFFASPRSLATNVLFRIPVLGAKVSTVNILCGIRGGEALFLKGRSKVRCGEGKCREPDDRK